MVTVQKVLKVVIKCELIAIFIIITVPKHCETNMRVLGGRGSLKDEFPFAVRLEIELTGVIKEKMNASHLHVCTGAALTPTWILTAAHCDDSNVLKLFYIFSFNKTLVARYNSHFPRYPGKVVYIIKTISHPAFSFYTFNWLNDIALHKSDKMEISRYAKVSAIDYTTLIGNEVLILGFGGTNSTQTKNPLQVLKGMLIKCLVKDPKMTPGLCLVSRCGFQATICGGDSGGPIVHPSGVIGVNSQSLGDCGNKWYSIVPGSSASVISVVSPVLDWISNTVADKTNDAF